MSKKAPDTRNKLDNNRPKKKRKLQVLTQKQLTEIVKEINHEPVIKLKAEKKPSKGALFKQQHGYSKTMKRLIKSYGASSPEDYKKTIRKVRKKVETKARQDKHSASVTYKRLNGKKKGSKTQGKSKASKLAETSQNKKK